MTRFLLLLVVAYFLNFAAPTPAAAEPALSPPSASEPSPSPGIRAVLSAIEANRFVSAYLGVRVLKERFPDHPDILTLEAKLAPLLRSALPPAFFEPRPARTPLAREQLPAALRTRFLLLTQRAAQPADSDQLLTDVKAFTLDAPDFPGAWLLQARLALALDRALEGRIAARNLLQLGVLQTTDPWLAELMSSLDRKGWVPRPTPPKP